LGVGNSLLKDQDKNAAFPISRPSSFEERFGGNYGEGGVRMEFNPNSFGSRRGLKDVQNKQLSLAREHRVLEAQQIAAIQRLAAFRQQLNLQHKQLDEHFEAFEASQVLVEVQQAKFNLVNETIGTNEQSVDNLLRGLQSRLSASKKHSASLVEYNKTLVEVHALKGSLLEYNNLVLQDALPLCP